ncbi:MAG: hypothetical protein FWB75_08270 [Oscillospiraceae bacterium]|nr:hypothetical protein [Oscillospiraceae bacterium]
MKTMTITATTKKPLPAAVFIPEEMLTSQATQEVEKRVRITLLMGQPTMTPCLIPVLHSSSPACVNSPFMVDGECYKLTAMSYGTPYGAVFVDDVDKLDVSVIGKALGTHPLFPNKANIVFVESVDGENLKARVWRRNAGEVPYTAESASVAGTAAMMLGKTRGTSVNLSMHGEDFRVEWDRCREGVSTTGPADMLKHG